ncbi:hypothetical protein [Aeromonas dhakensis]|uniref:hypothetical protein n=1 Tax=Aeromonas dhakensis TaxID=196024 RepID=UPI0030D0AACA
MQRTAASISQHDLHIAFNGRNHNGFIDDLGTHIHCSNVTDLDVYTIDVRAFCIRCKNVWNSRQNRGEKMYEIECSFLYRQINQLRDAK